MRVLGAGVLTMMGTPAMGLHSLSNSAVNPGSSPTSSMTDGSGSKTVVGTTTLARAGVVAL
jgi:hypothetical protein